jgi:hypothetical protein
MVVGAGGAAVVGLGALGGDLRGITKLHCVTFLDEGERLYGVGNPTAYPSYFVSYSQANQYTINDVSAKQHPVASGPDLKWLLDALSSGPKQISQRQLVSVIRGISDLLSKGDLVTLNTLMGALPVKSVTPEVSMAFLRVTFPVKRLIRNWLNFRERVRGNLKTRGLEHDEILRGL